MEGEIGRFRRRWLTPPPVVTDLAALNRLLADADTADAARVITGRAVAVGDAAAREATALSPLPAEPFDPVTLLSARVDTKARICIRQSYYSVPARLTGARVAVRLGAVELAVYDGQTRVAVHPRALDRGAEHLLLLDHYLEVLDRKPGALAGATALTTDRPDPDLVALEARRHRDQQASPVALTPLPDATAGSVTPINTARGFHRGTPTLAGYDTLLDNGAS